MAMVEGNYLAYPYFAPLGDAIFTKDTQSEVYSANGGRQDARDWTGGMAFSRPDDFLSYFQAIAVQNGFAVPRLGIHCDAAAHCAGDGGFVPYDPRMPQAFPEDAFYSTKLNQFVAPNGRRYIWIYIQERNQWVICDEDRNVATYQTFLAYTTDVLQSLDDGNGGPAYALLKQVEYDVDYYLEFNNQYVQSTLP